MAYSKNSFLANAPTKSFYTGLNYANLPRVTASVADATFTLTSKYNMRPDLLAHDLYDNVELWWVFSLRNLEIQDIVYKDGQILNLRFVQKDK